MFRILVVAVCLIAGITSYAQTAPSTSDVAGYSGLHLAAYQGNTVEIKRLISQGGDLDGRDQNGRTPAHVAAFASNDDALRAIAGSSEVDGLPGRRVSR